MSCAVYKYVYKGEIIYVGKSDSDVSGRISAHAHETKFIPYLSECEIFCASCKNPAHTLIMETFLINKYKPCLNVSMKYNDDLEIDICEPQWISYQTYLHLNDEIEKRNNVKTKTIITHITKKCSHILNLQNQIIGLSIILPILRKQKKRIFCVELPDSVYIRSLQEILIPLYMGNSTTEHMPLVSKMIRTKDTNVLSLYFDFSQIEFVEYEEQINSSMFAKCKHTWNYIYRQELKEIIRQNRRAQEAQLMYMVHHVVCIDPGWFSQYQWIYKWVLREKKKRAIKIELIPESQQTGFRSFIKANSKSISTEYKYRNRSKRFHLNRYQKIDDIQNQIVGTLLVLQIITDHYQEIKENGYKYAIFIPNDRYAWNKRYAMGLSCVGVTYMTNTSWTGYKLIHSVWHDEVGYHAELFIHHELISLSFHIKYKEKLHEEIQRLRLKQHQVLQELIVINMLPITDFPNEYQWIYKWILQEQAKHKP